MTIRILGLNYYDDMKDAYLSNLLRQDSIKNENQLMDLSGSSWQDYPDTGRSTGEFIIFYQVGIIDHVTHFTGPVSQSSS